MSDATEARAILTIVNDRGLHARAATKLVQLASRFPCEVLLTGPSGDEVNAKSVMGVLLLCASKGTSLTVVARGEKAHEATVALDELVRGRFGEPA